ncbi:MAG: hypothetical protein C5B48_14300 [Candidatus Rokuibacteriota bacterium]|nr:MAG: hypothetical protein C5B48_14300 [Candidatus Rokubacteria bacterium]
MDVHEAKMDLGNWFAKMLDELDEDAVDDPDAIMELKGRIANAFAEWRMASGWGIAKGSGTGPNDTFKPAPDDE